MLRSSAERHLLSACALAMLLPLGAAPVSAQNIIESWKSVSVPAPPELQPASVDSAHTALLLLDFNAETCTEAKRPSCARSIAPVADLLREARSKHMLVVYSAGPASSSAGSKTPQALTPMHDEPTVHAGADKFFHSDLEQILAGRDIHSVIIVGTSAQGAVLYTASSAALRGLTVIVPVDGFSSDSSDRFPELYTAWHLKHAPASISSHVILTRTDLITIR